MNKPNLPKIFWPFGGDGDQSWRDALPDELKTDPSLATVKDVASLAKQFVDAQKHIGGSIRIPSEDAGAEDWSKFHEKVLSKVGTLMRKPAEGDEESYMEALKGLGAKATKEEYKLEGVDESDSRLNVLRDLAIGAGMTEKQFKKAYEFLKEKDDASSQDFESKLKESRDGLMKEWGMAFEEKIQKAVDFMKKTGAPASLIAEAEKGRVNAETMKWMDKVRGAIGSEAANLIDDGKGNLPGKLTPEEAKTQIREIQNNKAHAYWNNRDPGHKAAIEKMVELNRLSGPNS